MVKRPRKPRKSSTEVEPQVQNNDKQSKKQTKKIAETESQVENDDKAKRSKNFSPEESEVLLSACDKFYEVINKNSNRDVDKKAKTNAWSKIKCGFDKYCKSQGIYVSKNLLLVKFSHFQCHSCVHTIIYRCTNERSHSYKVNIKH